MVSDFSIHEHCKVNANYEADTFVGIRCDNGEFSVNFPLGFDISDKDDELRKDILLLLNTIGATTARKESELEEQAKEYNQTAFPVQAYIAVIYDYYSRGYYIEREVNYVVSKRGKINWNRTIKTQKPYVQDGNIYYLDFVTKKNQINENELITLIHEYLVYESFAKIGWLFTKAMPKKPRLKYNEKLFRTVLRDKIAKTFNDKNRKLFMNMLAIVNYMGDSEAKKNYRYGTYRFEYVWEALIDKVFGIEGKKAYFPKATWHLEDGNYNNASLEPDTIMIWKNNVYVLDAKYYKYGATKRPGDLPESTSINKQITYGEYIAGEEKFKKIHGDDYIVYNAFLMPFNAAAHTWQGNDLIRRIGNATSNWKHGMAEYENIKGILVDVKDLMKNGMLQDYEKIEELADIISR